MTSSARSRSARNRSRGAAAPPAEAIRFSPASSPMRSAWHRGASTTSPSRAAASRCPRSSADRCRSASTAWPSLPRRSRRAPCASSPSRAANGCPAWTSPTLREQGVDVEFENWRSIVAPPGISADDRRRLAAALEAMVRSAEWQEMLPALPLARSLPRRRGLRALRDRGGSARPRDPAGARHGRQRGRLARQRRAVSAVRARRAGDLRRGRGRQRAEVVGPQRRGTLAAAGGRWR